MRQASAVIAPSKSATSSVDGRPVPSGAVTDVTPRRSFTVRSYSVFRIRRSWVVAGIPGEQVMVAVLPPSTPELPPEPEPELEPVPEPELEPVPEPELEPLPEPEPEPPEPELELPPLPEPTPPPFPEFELPPPPLGAFPITPVQLVAPASSNPARPVRMKSLICVYPSAGG